MAALKSLMLGATYLGASRCKFFVCAPFANCAQVRILGPSSGQWRVSATGHGEGTLVGMEKLNRGYHTAVADGIAPGTEYVYCLDGKDRPDPASRLQADGVNGWTLPYRQLL